MTVTDSGSRTTALVTGAAGFIGSHLVEYLLAAGWRVRGLDDFSSGTVENLRGPLLSRDFAFTEGSVLDERLVRSAAAGATHVFHLAGRVGALYVEQHPERTIREVVQATRTMLAVVDEIRAPLFFASTSEIYGDSGVQPLAEEADIIIAPPTNPRSSYAFGKGTGELLVNDYARRTGAPVVIGRLFNTIGVRQSGRYGSVVPRFVGWAQRDRPIVVYGDGRQTRSFTFVGDAVRAIAAGLTTSSAYGHTINIGSDQETSIGDLARLVIRLTGSSSTVRHESYDRVHGRGTRDIARRVPDTTRLRQLVGCRCATPLATAIGTIIESPSRVVAGESD
ncbi:NAD(P)-dependent oxidoreductase [Nocardia sp. BMG51109]|uniref:NAD-dependent epimerase/dehydratase family protein n=1 Tax=Nocardia sp. BMG51109 TaxID=1056816 RepID=UPI0004672FF6|nr:NAD-dependent epimerase/dehydratase family protein [Nocardia sp. BMG51109]